MQVHAVTTGQPQYGVAGPLAAQSCGKDVLDDGVGRHGVDPHAQQDGPFDRWCGVGAGEVDDRGHDLLAQLPEAFLESSVIEVGELGTQGLVAFDALLIRVGHHAPSLARSAPIWRTASVVVLVSSARNSSSASPHTSGAITWLAWRR